MGSAVHRFRCVYLVGHGIAADHQPASAARAVYPQFSRCPASVTSHQQVLRPLFVATVACGTRLVCIADVVKLGIGARTAKGTGKNLHGGFSVCDAGVTFIDQFAAREAAMIERL